MEMRSSWTSAFYPPLAHKGQHSSSTVRSSHWMALAQVCYVSISQIQRIKQTAMITWSKQTSLEPIQRESAWKPWRRWIVIRVTVGWIYQRSRRQFLYASFLRIGFCDDFPIGTYNVTAQLCNGECGSHHPHSQTYDLGKGSFTVTKKK